jgi:hypothetical protein
MSSENQVILLNDLLRLDNLSNTKIRLNMNNGDDFDPLRFFKEKNKRLFDGNFHNYNYKAFKEGEIAIGTGSY